MRPIKFRAGAVKPNPIWDYLGGNSCYQSEYVSQFDAIWLDKPNYLSNHPYPSRHRFFTCFWRSAKESGTATR